MFNNNNNNNSIFCGVSFLLVTGQRVFKNNRVPCKEVTQ